MDGQTNSELTLNTLSSSQHNGEYKCLIKNSGGWTPPSDPTDTASLSSVSICPNTNYIKIFSLNSTEYINILKFINNYNVRCSLHFKRWPEVEPVYGYFYSVIRIIDCVLWE